MNTKPTKLLRTARLARFQPGWRRSSRRGSVYVLVLGASTLIAIAGIGSVMLSRAGIRATSSGRDWSEGGIAAQSGLEYAIAYMNSTPTWRTDAVSGTTYGPIGIGNAKVAITFIDETDANLANDPTQAVRVYSVATVGTATRAYSAVAAPSSSAGYDVLRCPVHSDTSVNVQNDCTISGGPLSCNAAINNSATLTSDIETNTLSSSGVVLGYVQTGLPAKSSPGTAGWTAAAAGATTIPWGSIPGGTIDRKVLTPGLNSIGGGTNGNGVYAISVPLLSTLTIRRSRLQATLLVTLSASAKLVVQDENLWEPGGPNQASLIVQGGLLSSVSLSPSSSSMLKESDYSTNYNPAGAPYLGVINATMTDNYPNELHGLFHISSNIPVQLGPRLTLIGSLVAAGPVTISWACSFSANPALKTNPPPGYADPSGGKMMILPGTYRWEVSDVNASVTP